MLVPLNEKVISLLFLPSVILVYLLILNSQSEASKSAIHEGKKHFKKKFTLVTISPSKIFFLMGSGSLTQFHKWDKWREISKLSKIVVLPRSGYFKRSLKCKAMKVL